MKILKKIAFILFGAILACCMFTACNLIGNKVTVTYMVDGAQYVEQSYESEDTVALPKDPVKEGYAFVGWYKDEGLTQPYTVGTITSSFTLYAKFNAATVYIIINVDGGVKMDPVSVTPGGTYALDEAVKEGYTFVGYTYVDDNGDRQDFPISGTFSGSSSIRLTATYVINTYDVTFVGQTEVTEKVNYNATVTAPAMEKTGHSLVGWYTSQTFEEGTAFDFTQGIKDDLTLYAKYEPKQYTITVQNVQDGYGTVTATYGGSYTLPTPDRGENYTFQGFVYNGEAFAQTGTYVWAENITVQAEWDGTGKDILFYDGATLVGRVESEYGANIAALSFPVVPAKAGYSTDGVWYQDAACTTAFVKEGTLTTAISLYAKYTPNAYTVTFMVFDAATKTEKASNVNVVYGEVITPPQKAERDAYEFGGYYYFVNDEKVVFDVTAAYMVAGNIVVHEEWTLKSNATLLERNETGALYFRERETYDDAWTYVYLVGYEYTFNKTTLQMQTSGGEAFATITNKADGNATIKGLEAGSITVKVTKADGSYETTISIVESVNTFSVGAGYTKSWLGRDAKDWDADKLGVDEANKPVVSQMKVGRSNYIPDLEMTNINGEALSVSQANIEVSVKSGDSVITDYTVVNGGIYFGNTVADGTVVTVTIAPRYAIHKTHTASFTFTLNSGVNVYDNNGLKKAYADTAVSEINVLRNITAELDENQYIRVPAGKTGTVSGYNYTVGGEFYAAKNTQPDGTTGTGVYERFDGDMKINGNYFTVDGSKLYLIDARSDDDHYVGTSASYQAQNVQFGIFMYGHRSNTGARDNTLKMENLLLTGNFTGETFLSDHEVGNGVKILKYSGACIGVHVRNANLEMDNVTIRNCAFAANAYGNNSLEEASATLSANSATMKVTDCIFDRSWSNNIYVYGPCKVTLESSYIGSACGAAIHFDSRPSAGEVECDLVMDNDTVIENWVTGGEAWFELYNATSTVADLKIKLNGAVEQYSSMAVDCKKAENVRTIVKWEDGVQKVNFAIIMKTVGDYEDWEAVDKKHQMGSLAANFGCFDLIKFAGGDQAQLDNVATGYARYGIDASALGFGYMEVFVGMIDK